MHFLMRLDAPLSRRSVICMPNRRPVIRPAQIIALYGDALDNDRRVSDRIPRVNSDGFANAGTLPYLAF